MRAYALAPALVAAVLASAACKGIDLGPRAFYSCDEGGVCGEDQLCLRVTACEGHAGEDTDVCVKRTCENDAECGPRLCLGGHCGCRSADDCAGASCDLATGLCGDPCATGPGPGVDAWVDHVTNAELRVAFNTSAWTWAPCAPGAPPCGAVALAVWPLDSSQTFVCRQTGGELGDDVQGVPILAEVTLAADQSSGILVGDLSVCDPPVESGRTYGFSVFLVDTRDGGEVWAAGPRGRVESGGEFTPP